MTKLRIWILLFLWLCSGTGIAQAQAQPSLDDYLNSAYTNNPLLKTGKNAVKSAGIDSALVRSKFGPQIGFQGDASYYPANGKWGYDVAISNKGMLGSVVNFDQAIPFQNQMKPQLNAASISRQKAVNSLQLARKEIKRNVTRQYLVTYGDQLQYRYNREVLDTLQNESDVLLELTRARPNGLRVIMAFPYET
ncbi:MAG: TolC family protein [Desulfobacterales bacterium]